MMAPIPKAPPSLIDDALDRVHDWLMYDGHDFSSCSGCDTCDGAKEPDSDSQITEARSILEFIADEFTRYSDRNNPDA